MRLERIHSKFQILILMVGCSFMGLPSAYTQESSEIEFTNREVRDDSKVEAYSMEFFVMGMSNNADAIKAESLLVAHPGIDRARANSETRFCQIITLQGYKLGQQSIADLLVNDGFTIRNFRSKMIFGSGVEPSASAPIQKECEPNTKPSSSKVTSRELTAEQRLEQIVLLRKDALKNGTTTGKYDMLIMELKKEINDNKQSK